MDFVFGLSKDSYGNTGIVVFVDRLSKMAHLAAVPESIDGEGTAQLFIDRVFGQHGLPVAIVSDRDPRFTSTFWKSIRRCKAHDWTCPQRITRRPMVKPNDSIVSSVTYFAVFEPPRRSVGVP